MSDKSRDEAMDSDIEVDVNDDALVLIKSLKQTIKDLKKEKQEYLDGWQRSKAEIINVKRHAEERVARSQDEGRAHVIRNLLPVLDSFHEAKRNQEQWENLPDTWRTGMESLFQQLFAVLEKEGLETVGAEGEAFDPNLHEAVATSVLDDAQAVDTVTVVHQPGYRLAEKLLRPARVSIGVHD